MAYSEDDDLPECPYCHGERILPWSNGQARTCSYCGGMPTGPGSRFFRPGRRRAR